MVPTIPNALLPRLLCTADGFYPALFTEIAQNYVVPHRPGAIDTHVAKYLVGECPPAFLPACWCQQCHAGPPCRRRVASIRCAVQVPLAGSPGQLHGGMPAARPEAWTACSPLANQGCSRRLHWHFSLRLKPLPRLPLLAARGLQPLTATAPARSRASRSSASLGGASCAATPFWRQRLCTRVRAVRVPCPPARLPSRRAACARPAAFPAAAQPLACVGRPAAAEPATQAQRRLAPAHGRQRPPQLLAGVQERLAV